MRNDNTNCQLYTNFLRELELIGATTVWTELPCVVGPAGVSVEMEPYSRPRKQTGVVSHVSVTESVIFSSGTLPLPRTPPGLFGQDEVPDRPSTRPGDWVVSERQFLRVNSMFLYQLYIQTKLSLLVSVNKN